MLGELSVERRRVAFLYTGEELGVLQRDLIQRY